MTRRLLITTFAAAIALHDGVIRAQAGPDSFIPNAPPKSAADAKAGEKNTVKYVLLLPADKSSEAVKEAERNPFGKNEDDSHNLGSKTSNEETKIQEQLSKLHATGISPGPTGLRVLLGDMWLSKNDIMPPVVKDQTLSLRVSDVTRDTVQLVWMEKKFTGLPPRTFNIQVNLRPTVRRVPYGQVPDKTDKTKVSKAVLMATAVETSAAITARSMPAENPGSTAEATASPENIPAVVTRSLPRLTSETAPAPAKNSAPATASTTVTPVPPAAPEPQQTPQKQEAPAVVATASAPVINDPGPPLSPEARPTSVKSQVPALASESEPSAAKAPPSPQPEPASWKKAMGLLENLTRLSEAGKK